MKKQKMQEYETMRERDKSGNIGITIVCTALGCLIIAIGIVFFAFRVNPNEVVVEGNVHYTEDEIKQWVMDDFISQNTILASLLKGDDNVQDIPFIESYQVDFLERNKICITVNEKEVVGYVEENQMCYYFDRDGMIVEETEGTVMTAEERMQQEESKLNEESGMEGEDGIAPSVEETPVKNFVPPVRGLSYTIETTQKNNKTVKHMVTDNKSVFNTMASLKQMINKDNIPPKYVTFDEEYNIYLFYESIEVRLGKDVDLENKMTTLAAILPKIEGMSGTLMLENYSDSQNGVIFQKKE